MGIQPPPASHPSLSPNPRATSLAFLRPDTDDDARHAAWERAHVAVRQLPKGAHPYQLPSVEDHLSAGAGGLAISAPGGDVRLSSLGGCSANQRRELRRRILAWRENTYLRAGYYSTRAAILSEQSVEGVVAPEMVASYMAEGEDERSTGASGVLASGTEMMRALERAGLGLGPSEVASVDTWDALVVVIRRWRDECLGRGKKRERVEEEDGVGGAELTPRSKQRFWTAGV
ncbi:hypothetical protein IAT38_006284 [Cryptococcus sp. DSM 104549]